VAWSLCFEEQFYLMCFLALWLAPGRMMYPALGVATLVIVAARALVWQFGDLWSIRGTFPLLWHEFAVGLAVFYRFNVAKAPIERRLVDVGLAALLLTGLLTAGRETVTAAAFGLVLIALKRWDVRSESLGWLAPFRASGRRCYSIYLAHLPVCVVGNHWLFDLGLTSFWARTLVMMPLVSVAGVAAGWAFHALVETHFLNPPPALTGVGASARPGAFRWRLPAGARPSAAQASTP
jgi:peptidoglycan/LPS O-acetylase OafA/YrhL